MYIRLNRTICNTIEKTRKYVHRLHINYVIANTVGFEKWNGINKYRALNNIIYYELEIKDVDKVWVSTNQIPRHELHTLSYISTYCK